MTFNSEIHKNALAKSAPNAGQPMLTRAEFQQLADVPPAVTWYANLKNERTARAYWNDLQDFIRFVGIQGPEDFRLVTRAHVLAWLAYLKQKHLAHLGGKWVAVSPAAFEQYQAQNEAYDAADEKTRRQLGLKKVAIKPAYKPSTIRRKLSALSSLSKELCDANAITHNAVTGVSRPKGEGSTPVLSDEQTARLLEAPPSDTLKGLRDRAILATIFFHGLRELEICRLTGRSYYMEKGIMIFHVHGKGDKWRKVVVNPIAQMALEAYLDACGHRGDLDGALFRPVRNRSTKAGLNKPINPSSIYDLVKKYAAQVGILDETPGACVHTGRITFSSNAKENGADIKDIQESLGHKFVATTERYIVTRMQLEDSPTLKINYTKKNTAAREG